MIRGDPQNSVWPVLILSGITAAGQGRRRFTGVAHKKPTDGAPHAGGGYGAEKFLPCVASQDMIEGTLSEPDAWAYARRNGMLCLFSSLMS